MYKEEKPFSSTKISHKAKNSLYLHATIWRLYVRRIQSLLAHDILPYTEFFRHPTLDFILANRKIRLTTFTHDTIGSLLAIPPRYFFLFSNTRKVEIHSLSESWD